MELDKQLLEAWQNGVPLGHAWWVFAYAKNKRRFLELQPKGEHLGLQNFMEHELVWRIDQGELQAFGIEDGSDAGPILIPKYYFSKTAKIDWDKETVTALGKKFYEVTVQGEREPADEALTETDPIDLRTIEGVREPIPDIPPSEPESSNEPLTQAEQEAAEEAPPSEPTPAKFGEAPLPLPVGRPSKWPEIERAMDILLERGVELGKIRRPDAIAAIRECARNELNSDITIGFHKSVIQVCLFRRFGPRR
jgi:hypothetical protein